jgi:hypothetical protein
LLINIVSEHAIRKNEENQEELELNGKYQLLVYADHLVLYGCETWSLTLREKYILRVFENRVLRRIFGPNREEGAGGCRR